MISIQNVSKLYQGPKTGVAALQDISLEIDKGDFLAIMGPSGSGKTTLLSVLGAMNPPTHGKVIVDGIDLYSLSGDALADFRRHYLGFVFQQLHLIPYLTAVENVMVPLVVSSENGARLETAARALGSVGLKDRMLQLPDQLSGGEQGRVAIARAVVNDPPILLADEPTGDLDSATGEEIMRLLRALNEKGRTIIMVTHNPDSAAYASRIVVVRDGRIVEERRGTATGSTCALPELPAAEITCGAWAEQAELAAQEAHEDEDAEDDEGEWIVIALIVIAAAAILSFVLLVLQFGVGELHVH